MLSVAIYILARSLRFLVFLVSSACFGDLLLPHLIPSQQGQWSEMLYGIASAISKVNAIRGPFVSHLMISVMTFIASFMSVQSQK